ncbi:MAG: tetratricopeptide repeat protein [Bacteroidetes bacterium]|nr:tetratricopeptide repeat protein [Bacteroidota bacterium]
MSELKKIVLKQGEAKAFDLLGQINYFDNKNKDALIFFQNSLKIFTESKDKYQIANQKMNVGKIYDIVSDNDTALDLHKEALEFYVSQKDTARMAKSNMSISNVYRIQGFYDLSLDYALQGLQFYRTEEWSLNGHH